MVAWTRSLTVAVALGIASVAMAAAEPAKGAAADGQNVKLTVRLGLLVDGGRTNVKSYELVLIDGGVSSKLLSGARVPFRGPEGPVYQNIGFTTEAHAWVLEDGRIKIVATIEDSRLVETGADRPPTVETRQVAVNAILEPGEPMEVTRVDGIRDQSGFLEIEAKVVQ
jgi:hypothetical protein